MKNSKRSTKKTKGQSWSYWVWCAPHAWHSRIFRKDAAWEPDDEARFWKGPFWKAKYARAYGRTMCYGEVAKARNAAFAFKFGKIEKE